MNTDDETERYWYWDDSLHTRLAGRIKRMLKGETDECAMPEASGEAHGVEADDSIMDTASTSGPEATSSEGDYHDDSKEREEFSDYVHRGDYDR